MLTRKEIDKMSPEFQKMFWRNEHLQIAGFLRPAIRKAIKECPNHNLPEFVVRFANQKDKGLK